MPPTPFLGSRASFQGQGPLPTAWGRGRGGGGGYASGGRRNRLLPKDAQYPLGTADLKGFAMPPTPFLGSGASFQGPGPLPMASARRAIGISLIESFWRAIGAEIEPFS